MSVSRQCAELVVFDVCDKCCSCLVCRTMLGACAQPPKPKLIKRNRRRNGITITIHQLYGQVKHACCVTPSLQGLLRLHYKGTTVSTDTVNRTSNQCSIQSQNQRLTLQLPLHGHDLGLSTQLWHQPLLKALHGRQPLPRHRPLRHLTLHFSNMRIPASPNLTVG